MKNTTKNREELKNQVLSGANLKECAMFVPSQGEHEHSYTVIFKNGGSIPVSKNLFNSVLEMVKNVSSIESKTTIVDSFSYSIEYNA